MQYSTFALLGLASSALALPQVGVSGVPQFGNRFGLTASGGSISNRYNQVTASRGRLFVGGEQSPVCEGGQRADFATFVWYSDRTVFLYKTDNPPQQVWVDSTGLSGFETVGQNTKPPGAGTEGFNVDAAGALTFNGATPKACPVDAAKYSIYFPQDAQSDDNEDCEPITLTAYRADARVSCKYSDPVDV